MNENQQALEQAYQLIEAGQLEKARSLLEGILAQDRNSIDAWWLYAHAVEDPQQAVTALENVKRLDPHHAEAEALLQTAHQQVGIIRSTDDELDDDELDIAFDEEQKPDIQTEPSDNRKRIFVVGGGIVGLILLGVIILVGSPRGDNQATSVISTETLVAQNVSATATPTPNDIITPMTISTSTPFITEPISNQPNTATPNPDLPTQVVPTITIVPPTEPPVDVSADAFLTSLSANYPTQGVTQTVETVLGTTLLVPMCTARGDEHTQLIPRAMNGLSQHIERVPSDYTAVGVRFLNCSTNETINVIITPRVSALEYKNKDLSEQDFRRSWRVVDV